MRSLWMDGWMDGEEKDYYILFIWWVLQSHARPAKQRWQWKGGFYPRRKQAMTDVPYCCSSRRVRRATTYFFIKTLPIISFFSPFREESFFCSGNFSCFFPDRWMDGWIHVELHAFVDARRGEGGKRPTSWMEAGKERPNIPHAADNSQQHTYFDVI